MRIGVQGTWPGPVAPRSPLTPPCGPRSWHPPSPVGCSDLRESIMAAMVIRVRVVVTVVLVVLMAWGTLIRAKVTKELSMVMEPLVIAVPLFT